MSQVNPYVDTCINNTSEVSKYKECPKWIHMLIHVLIIPISDIPLSTSYQLCKRSDDQMFL
jgi:hypothetical protein